MKFQILHRWSDAVKFECDLSAEMEGASRSAQLGFAVKKAIESGSNLSRSNLSGSNLRDSNLSGSNLSGSNLSGSDLTPIRDDLWAVLSAAPREVQGLRDALAAGKVDGSQYEGACACLVGTIANVRGDTNYQQLGALKPNSSRPAERFFLGINKGDMPETSQFSKLALDWTDEWLGNMRAAFGAQEVAP